MPQKLLTDKKPTGLLAGRPALKICLVYAMGIVAGNYLPAIPVIILFSTITAVAAACILHSYRKSQLASMLVYLSLFMVGSAQYMIAVSGFPPAHIANIAQGGGNAAITGMIVEEPDIRTDRTYLTVAVDSLTWRNRDIKSSGRVLVKIKEPSKEFSFKDRIRFSGYLFAPGGSRIPGGFDFARYLNYREIFGMVVLSRGDDIEITRKPPSSWWSLLKFWSLDEFFINDMVAPARRILLEGYEKYLPSEYASLLAGFILGEKRNIPEAAAKLFRDTGTFHLMAVSGSNVGVIVAFVLFLLRPVNRRWRIIAVLLAIIFFSFLTRNEPSVVRASIMASIVMLGFYRQRNADSAGLLGFACLIILVFKPLWLFNAGFQLSVAACAGIIYFFPLFYKQDDRKNSLWLKGVRGLYAVIATTISAQIMVLPITAQYFNRLPLAGVLANIPMIGLAGILTIGGLIFLPFIIIGETTAMIFALPLKLLISVISPLLNFFAGLPAAVITVEPPGIWKIAVFYSVLYIVSEYIFTKRFSIKTTIILLTALCGLVWTSYLKGPQTESLTFIDCGPDRAILFSSNDGNNYLWYDCHEDDRCRQIELSLLRYLCKAGVNYIDTIFTNNKTLVRPLSSDIEVMAIIEHRELFNNEKNRTKGINQYYPLETILNKRVKFVCYKSDNNSEPLYDGYYYKLETIGGLCILAGGLSPYYVRRLKESAFILEIPWSVQPYGAIFEMLKAYPPALLVFSPEKGGIPSIRSKEMLTYMKNRTWAASINGSFRFRFEKSRIIADYMIESSE
ncbi:MAG: ComEC family competence protein [candidate division Zixibacteria bacterium]|nr:ComEC family competence protein [candidate division Zixibacteria bacterium]